MGPFIEYLRHESPHKLSRHWQFLCRLSFNFLSFFDIIIILDRCVNDSTRSYLPINQFITLFTVPGLKYFFLYVFNDFSQANKRSHAISWLKWLDNYNLFKKTQNYACFFIRVYFKSWRWVAFCYYKTPQTKNYDWVFFWNASP